jgi:hypothetical protein
MLGKQPMLMTVFTLALRKLTFQLLLSAKAWTGGSAAHRLAAGSKETRVQNMVRGIVRLTPVNLPDTLAL